MTAPLHIGLLIYPNVTQLDATGPAQVLSRVPGARMHMVWKTLDPVPTDAGFSIVPTTTFASRSETPCCGFHRSVIDSSAKACLVAGVKSRVVATPSPIGVSSGSTRRGR